jgi:hypothetical protein
VYRAVSDVVYTKLPDGLRSSGDGRSRGRFGIRVDAAVERLVSLARRLVPIPHRVPAHEPRAHLLARQLVEKFLLVGDREMAVAPPGVKSGNESSENSFQSCDCREVI